VTNTTTLRSGRWSSGWVVRYIMGVVTGFRAAEQHFNKPIERGMN
jgi:hypothetical protein